MKLLSPVDSEQLRNFILENKSKVIESAMMYDASENEPCMLEDKKRLYLLGMALADFSEELFVVYFPDRLKELIEFPNTWDVQFKNSCLATTKAGIVNIDDIVPEYYIFDKIINQFVFVDAEGNIYVKRY